MKIKCIANKGDCLKEYDMPYGFSDESVFGMEIGEEFIVMGILSIENNLYYLVDDGELPYVFPYQLFEILDTTIPSNWYFNVPNNKGKPYSSVQGIWGYFELCNSNTHYDKLLEFDEIQMNLYFKRKSELYSH